MYLLPFRNAAHDKKVDGTFWICLLALALGACAKPQYLSGDSATTAAAKAGTGCMARFATSQACVDLKWEKRPTETEFGSFVFTTSNDESNLIDIEAGSATPLKIVLWMPSMGHGSSPVAIEKIGAGFYRAKNVFFNMKADWEIRFQLGSDQAVYALFL